MLSNFQPVQEGFLNICWALLGLAIIARPQPGLSSFMTALAIGGISLSSVSGHSFVEQLRLVSTNGTFRGSPGYPRGNGLFLA